MVDEISGFNVFWNSRERNRWGEIVTFAFHLQKKGIKMQPITSLWLYHDMDDMSSRGLVKVKGNGSSTRWGKLETANWWERITIDFWYSLCLRPSGHATLNLRQYPMPWACPPSWSSTFTTQTAPSLSSVGHQINHPASLRFELSVRQENDAPKTAVGECILINLHQIF